MPNSFAKRYSIPLLWLGVLVFFTFAAALYQPILPNDYWWYVRIGQEIVAQGTVPVVDTLSHTQAGQPVVYHSWLSAVLFWLAYDWGGFAATALLRGLALVGFYTAVWLTCRQTGVSVQVATLLTLLAAFAGSNNWVMRPQMFAYPLFGLALLILWRWGQGKQRGLWLLPLLMLAWVNLHGSFIIGFLLVGAAFVAGPGDRRALLGPFAGMFLVSLINPRGFGSWVYVLSLITDVSSQQYSVEWRPPSNQTLTDKLFFGWLLLFGFLAALSPRKMTPTQWLWFLGYGWLALSGIRYVVWFVALLAPISAHLLTPLVNRYLGKPPQTIRPGVNGLITAMLLLTPLLLLPGLRHSWWPDAAPTLSPNTPIEAAAWLADNADLPGPLWSDLNFASYQIFALPQYPVWIDTRFELYPPEQWARYLRIATAAPDWRDILDEEGINLLLLDPENQPRLRQALAQVDTWGLCYEDEVALLYARLVDGRLPPVCPNAP
jgi:hypothetical protein